ncbi:1,4-dihydroxy-2-naphthoate prenyltransferase [Maribacter vaceletii]|uniref:1,4-dihydroxy-2-naphthoate octaprenyltransferase n=1 Tax=Maribacter vaceletii TaxID=1206816 RepID=A0A495E7M3_9FLAO|nr:1,4-dihydroxy-2-naphthoate octaprenyltransferase [Maribacter vaceletii]RKR12924.1 1,4-dihydroxy-2-naphthoate prenyltransferase [Maribacter vaceletii]
MNKVNIWLNAARLRTLPLSVSGILVGTAIANLYGFKDYIILVLALCTTIGFQITSNFANDYGDGVKGTDNEDRIGPQRVLQSGLLSRVQLKKGIFISIGINIVFVLALVFYSFGIENWKYIILFLILGAFSIWAAIKYTVGKSAYGYRGLGDIFVFLFFGLLSVLGTLFLYTKYITFLSILPAITVGTLSTGVLNLNNLRDFNSDKKALKNTLVVKMGYENGKIYHYVLLAIAVLCLLVFTIKIYQNWFSLLPLIVIFPLLVHAKKVVTTLEPIKLDPELKKLALATFFMSILIYFCYNYFL